MATTFNLKRKMNHFNTLHNELRPMRIVHVIQTLSPKFGGPATVLKSIAKEQSRIGHQVTILTTNLDYPRGILTSNRHDMINGSLAKVRYFSSEIPFAFFSKNLALSLQQMFPRIDILHSWCLYRFPQAYACYFARKKGLPYIVRPCGSLEPFLFRQSAVSLPLKRIYEWLIEWPNLHKASAINCVTQQEANNLPKFIPANKVFVLGNGIDWEMFEHLPERGLFRKRFAIKDKIPLILFLGRLNFKKGHDLLVLSLVHVLEQIPNAHLAIVGPDNEGYGAKVRQWCKEQNVTDKVLFTGHLDPGEVQQAYVDANVFVLPSYTENFGMAVLEAMACGCPVVVSDQVNIWREIQQEGAGLVVSLDPSHIAKAICQVLLDHEIAEKMGRRGRIAAKNRYSWPCIVDKMTKIYEQAIDFTVNKCR